MTTYELPLFPLNTVLFPGMPLKLHIFEERYKRMIRHCYDMGQPFGVTLIKSGHEVGSSAQPFSIGCTAVITELEPLPGGRMNIMAVGQDRFMIQSLKHEQPYLVGIVETCTLTNQSPDSLEHSSELLRSWVQKYLQILAKASETPFDTNQLPSDPLRLAYLASFLLNVPSEQKQDLLDINVADELVKNLRMIYRREVTLLDEMLKPQQAIDIGPFSSN
jgi:Lon protease-like protein